MILNPVVADVLDKAAEHVSEVAVMPTKFSSCGREMGDPGFDARSAIAFAMIDARLVDDIESSSGYPHLSKIVEMVADFGSVPEDDRTLQDMRFEVGGRTGDQVSRRDRRNDDLVMWGRGLATTEVANLFRWAAEDFRARPVDEGVYPDGCFEHAASRGGVYRDTVIKVSQAAQSEVPVMGMVMSQALLGMLGSAFGHEANPDPEVGKVSKAEGVTPARLAEIAQGVIDLINRVGWTDTYLFHPQDGRVSVRGALALTVDLPPRMDYLISKLHQTELRWVEMWTFDRALGDFLGLTENPTEPCGGCGELHTQDRVSHWENSGLEQWQVIQALVGFRDAQVTVAAHDAGLGSDLESVDWEEFARQLSGGGAES